MTEKRITLPDDLALIPNLEAGERVLLSGEIYTLRDAGHKRLVESIKAGKPDFDVSGKAIYYCGPTPTAGRRNYRKLRTHDVRAHGRLRARALRRRT